MPPSTTPNMPEESSTVGATTKTARRRASGARASLPTRRRTSMRRVGRRKASAIAVPPNPARNGPQVFGSICEPRIGPVAHPAMPAVL